MGRITKQLVVKILSETYSYTHKGITTYFKAVLLIDDEWQGEREKIVSWTDKDVWTIGSMHDGDYVM